MILFVYLSINFWLNFTFGADSTHITVWESLIYVQPVVFPFLVLLLYHFGLIFWSYTFAFKFNEVLWLNLILLIWHYHDQSMVLFYCLTLNIFSSVILFILTISVIPSNTYFQYSAVQISVIIVFFSNAEFNIIKLTFKTDVVLKAICMSTKMLFINYYKMDTFEAFDLIL